MAGGCANRSSLAMRWSSSVRIAASCARPWKIHWSQRKKAVIRTSTPHSWQDTSAAISQSRQPNSGIRTGLSFHRLRCAEPISDRPCRFVVSIPPPRSPDSRRAHFLLLEFRHRHRSGRHHVGRVRSLDGIIQLLRPHVTRGFGFRVEH